MQLAHISFLRQFREEEIELPVMDRKYRNTFLRHFSCSKKEKALIEQCMEQRLAHSGLISSLIHKIETEDLDTGKLLSASANKMLRLFTTIAREEPYTSRYYRKVSQALVHLIESLENSRESTRNRMQFLKDIVAGKNAHSFQGADFRDLQFILTHYLDTLSTHYQDLLLLLDQDSDESGKVQLVTRAESSFFNLLALLEKTVTSVESTIGKVEEWRKRWRSLIIEETYN